MITIRSKVYVSYLYMLLKYKSLTVYIKNKKGGVLTSQYKKELLILNMLPKNKQNKEKRRRMRQKKVI